MSENNSKRSIESDIKNLEIQEKDLDSKTNKRRHTGVGVLILTNYNNKPHFLLGREEYKSVKVDDDYLMSIYEEFGGGIQKRNLSLEENACFELQEETCNIFNITNSEIINSGINMYFDIPFMKKRMYRLYLVYIQDVYKIRNYFYKNRDYLKKNENTYYKYKSFLEMNNLELISLDEIKEQINNRDNYICNSAEDTLYNMNTNKNFKGILRVKNDIFLSKRLVDFLNMNFNINDIINQVKNTKTLIQNNFDLQENLNISNRKTGFQFCYELFKEGFINSKFKNDEKSKILVLGTPFINEKDRCKLKFLSGTWSFNLYLN